MFRKDGRFDPTGGQKESHSACVELQEPEKQTVLHKPGDEPSFPFVAPSIETAGWAREEVLVRRRDAARSVPEGAQLVVGVFVYRSTCVAFDLCVGAFVSQLS